MCGGGTLLVEAAMMGLGIAPGLGRGFGFERLTDFDASLYKSLRDQAGASQARDRVLALFGCDLHGSEIAHARENLCAAGLDAAVRLKQANITDLRPRSLGCAQAGVIVMNPPYGVRLGEPEELAALYPKLGDWLKQHFAGWRCYILSADPALPKGIRLQASRRTPLFNGALECRLYEYRIVPGSMRRKPAAAIE
jgi:putative N6-adenine-specific DNA methylase